MVGVDEVFEWFSSEWHLHSLNKVCPDYNYVGVGGAVREI